MQINAMQLKQIAAICEALTKVEDDDGVYHDNPNDATAINSELGITARETGRKLGKVKMGTGSSYVFESA